MKSPTATATILIAVSVAALSWLLLSPRPPKSGSLLVKGEPQRAAPPKTKPTESPATPVTPPAPQPQPLIAEPPPPPPVVILPRPRIRQDAAKPGSVNFALAANGAKASGGHNAALLIDGNSTDYDGGSGYGHTDWNAQPSPSFIITLSNSTRLDVIRFLLWDREENRHYRYKLEISPEVSGDEWKMIADRSAESLEAKGWQLIQFQPQPVRRIRLTGTYNNINSGFHVVELEAFLGIPPRKGSASESPDF
ncbi:MAG TPA: discoidin domain-containing protein [Planctomycetota bacterium]|nr:discoidin domain-containing protein [Planctomycetota bacterium]